MSEGYEVDVEQLRTHAGNVDSVGARFEAVISASSHIAQNDEAYGLLCGWIAAVLEGRHTRQDELIAYVAENLALAAEALRTTASDYEAMEDTASGLIGSAGGELTP
ncbi:MULTISPECIES: type VII secretion target [Actinoalloteichus]|uniref:type VII secretion target n=1 Tax=Actinoalloteichus TaxID=65496 RepID=UPI000950E665|nr:MULTISPECIES: type VII secretion target [Actinoalloteichus]